MYNGNKYDAEWMQNNTILIMDAIESSTSLLGVPIEDYNGMQFDASKIGLEYDLNGGHPSNGDALVDNFGGDRKRRSIRNAYYNPYSQRIIESDNEMSSLNAWDGMDSPDSRRHKRDIFSTDDSILANLPANRTIYFDCKNTEQELCLQGKFTVTNFKANDLPILITLNFTIDLKKVEKIMTEKRDVFVVKTSVDLMRTSDEEDK